MDTPAPKERATYSISSELKASLEAAVPKSQRSRFVERALQQALRADALERVRTKLDEIRQPRSEGETTTEFLSRKRYEWDGRPAHVLDGNSE